MPLQQLMGQVLHAVTLSVATSIVGERFPGVVALARVTS